MNSVLLAFALLADLPASSPPDVLVFLSAAELDRLGTLLRDHQNRLGDPLARPD